MRVALRPTTGDYPSGHCHALLSDTDGEAPAEPWILEDTKGATPGPVTGLNSAKLCECAASLLTHTGLEFMAPGWGEVGDRENCRV